MDVFVQVSGLRG